jgi:hypothetical protein
MWQGKRRIQGLFTVRYENAASLRKYEKHEKQEEKEALRAHGTSASF